MPYTRTVKGFHTVAETATFVRDAERQRLPSQARQDIVESVARNPTQGDEIQGSGGIRKVRFAGRGKGKSGGYRALVAYLGTHMPVYLLALLSKGERANFTAAEIAAFKAVVGDIRRAWQERMSQ